MADQDDMDKSSGGIIPPQWTHNALERIESIDRICDAFEKSLREGAAPRLEDFLNNIPDTDEPLLRQELEAVERSYRDSKSLPLGPNPPNSAEPPTLSPGVTFFEDYEILEELGRGGMGTVYRAHQISADREVAVKLIRTDRLSKMPPERHRRWLEQFLIEARAAARIEHESVVPVYQVAEAETQPFYSMRLISGPDLGELLKNGPLPAMQAASLFEKLARAIHHAHVNGVLHQDLKPQNILIDQQGRGYITDFGLAKFIIAGADPSAETEPIAGSPPYMAPEQVHDASKTDPRSDVYGLGATLYHAVTGRPPFTGSNVAETLCEVLNTQPLPPSSLQASIDKNLEAICLKCLKKVPSERYESALALAEDLRRYVQGDFVAARPPSRLHVGTCWLRRRAWWGAVFLVALAIPIIFLVGTHLVQSRRAERTKNARELLNFLVQQLDDEKLEFQPNFSKMRQEMIGKASQQCEILERESSWGREGAVEMATAFRLIGRYYLVKGEIAKAEHSLWRGLSVLDQAADGSPEQNGPERARLLFHLGEALQKRNKFAEAEKAFTQSREFRRDKLTASADRDARRELALTDYALGILLSSQKGRRQEAMAYYDTVRTMQEALLRDFPQDAEMLQSDLARTLNNLGILAIHEGKVADAMKIFLDVTQRQNELVEGHPAVPVFRRYLMRSRHNLALAHRASKQYAEATQTFSEVLKSGDTMTRDFPDVPICWQEHAACHQNFGELLEETKQPKLAESHYRKAVEIGRRLIRDNAEIAEYRSDLALWASSLAEFHLRHDRPAEATPLLAEALTIRKDLADQFSEISVYLADLGDSYFLQAQLLVRQDKLGDAKLAGENAASAHGKANSPRSTQALRHDYRFLAALALRMKDPMTASEMAEKLPDLVPVAQQADECMTAAEILAQCVSLTSSLNHFDTDQKRKHATIWGKRAVELIQEARRRGWNRVEDLQSQSFDSIRFRMDFAEIIRNWTTR